MFITGSLMYPYWEVWPGPSNLFVFILCFALSIVCEHEYTLLLTTKMQFTLKKTVAEFIQNLFLFKKNNNNT